MEAYAVSSWWESTCTVAGIPKSLRQEFLTESQRQQPWPASTTADDHYQLCNLIALYAA